MSEREIGFGVLGLGMGTHHCRALAYAEGARLVAACDVDPVRLEAAVKEFGCKAYADYKDMLADPEIEVISVVTPSGMHLEHSLQAARAGKHILIEKPIEITPGKIQQLIDGIAETGVKCGCIFQSRTKPLYIKMREAVQAGRLGKLTGMYSVLPWYREDSYYSGEHGSWHGTWELDGGGSLMNQGIHNLDLMIFLCGPVRSVQAKHGIYGHDIETEDTLAAIIHFESGVLATLSTTTCCYPGLPGQYLIYGTKGCLHADERGLIEWRIAGENEAEESKAMLAEFGPSKASHAVAADAMAVEFLGHIVLTADLAAAIHEDREPMVPLQEARKAPEVACAIYESARTGKEVFINT